MLLRTITISACLLAAGCASTHSTQVEKPIPRSPSEIINNAPASGWQAVDPENILRVDLPTGAVYVALNPELAPGHVDNIKKLAREGFYKDTTMYRFVESFVAQGGDKSGKKVPQVGKKGIPAEFFLTSQTPINITSVDAHDGYAANSGFLNGFAVAQNAQGTKTWMAHCTGAVAMARGNEADSGGTEFYFTLTPHRYLDKNTTVFGRVLEGMEHVQRLLRTPVEGEVFNPILGVHVLADIRAKDNSQFTVFNTASDDFKELIAARKNRPGAWFLDRPNHTDVCSVAVPTKRVTGG